MSWRAGPRCKSRTWGSPGSEGATWGWGHTSSPDTPQRADPPLPRSQPGPALRPEMSQPGGTFLCTTRNAFHKSRCNNLWISPSCPPPSLASALSDAEDKIGLRVSREGRHLISSLAFSRHKYLTLPTYLFDPGAIAPCSSVQTVHYRCKNRIQCLLLCLYLGWNQDKCTGDWSWEKNPLSQ